MSASVAYGESRIKNKLQGFCKFLVRINLWYILHMRVNLFVPLLGISFGLLLNSTSADDSLLFLGGGGEPFQKSSTIFDSTVIGLNNYLLKRDWRYDISYNGGHSYSEDLRNNFLLRADTKENFTKKTYENLIDKYKDNIKSGKIKPGEKILVVIDTHGADKEEDSSEITHHVSINSRDLKSNETVSLDELKVLSKLAKEKGIKLGIVDFSCHSGHTLALANENTCVISATGPKHFGYSSFSDNFMNEMKAGGNLEDIFLRTRLKEKYASYPMISTNEGQTIYKEFYPTLIPYLYYYDKNPNQEKMSQYLLDVANNPTCPRDGQMDELQKKIELLQKTTLKNIPEVEAIKSLFINYKRKQDEYVKFLQAAGSKDLGKKERVWSIGRAGKSSYTMGATLTWREIIESEFEPIIKNLETIVKYSDSQDEEARNRSKLNYNKEALELQQKLLKKNPGLAKYKEDFKKYSTFLEDSRKMAEEIAFNERKLFSVIYNELKKDAKQPNPCRDFTL